jgi:hypothetical protein
LHYVIGDHEMTTSAGRPRSAVTTTSEKVVKMTDLQASAPITLAQEVSRREELADRYTGIHFLEDMGAGIFGKAKGENVLLIALHYRVGGSVWGVEDTVINNTTFHAAPYDRQTIENNDFISHRIDPIHRSDDFSVVEEPDRVVWRAGDRTIIARPPFWDIRGEHLGVDVDVTMERTSEPDWYIGRWEDLPTEGRGGRDFWAKTSGTITARGKTYELEDNSYSINEHLVFGENWVLEARKFPVQYFYHLYRSEELQIFLYARPDSGVVYSRVVFTDGPEIFYDWDQVSVEEMEYWFDPQTGLRPPVKFRVTLDNPAGCVELVLTAYSRSLYSFQLSEGTRTHYNYFVHSEGNFTGPDGKITRIRDSETDTCFSEWGITSPLGSGAPLLEP